MSQQLIPVSGGITPEVRTQDSTIARINVLSTQYIQAKKLEDQLTEWVPGGRPIYRRLPAISETYQIDFFNVVNESNVLGFSDFDRRAAELGYVYIPYGDGIDGNSSCKVISSDSRRDLLIKGGSIVWKYGKTEIVPTIVNLELLEVLSGKYDVAYQLIYDDAPTPQQYSVSDFALTGLPLDISASTDSIIGWRYPAVNAFLNTDTLFWANKDTYFPSFADPSTNPNYTPFIQWESTLGQAYSKILLRCPSGSVGSGTAILSYVEGGTQVSVTSASVQSDSFGFFFELEVSSPIFQNGWNVSFTDPTIAIQSINVSGVITLLERPAAPAPRATLVIYPSGASPTTVINSQGKEIPATYAQLAEVDVSSTFTIESIRDVRNIIHRDYTPVADWLTLPFDRNLIDLYEQVSDYSGLWMRPSSALKFEYAELGSDQVQVIP